MNLVEAKERGLLSEKGMNKILNFRKINEEKYGENIFKEYDEAVKSKDPKRISESFYFANGTKYKEIKK